MPRILRIINRFNLGGPTYNAAYLTRYLEPSFQTLLVGGEREEGEASSEFILDELGVEREMIPDMQRSIDPFKDRRAYKRIRSLIHSFEPDIVHTHASKAGALGRKAALEENVPLIFHTFHGHVFHSYFGRVRTLAYKKIERYLARRSTKLIALSEEQKGELVDQHRIAEADKVEVLPLGFDLSRFREGMDEKRVRFRERWNVGEEEVAIGIVGRLVPVKGHELFLEAIAELRHRTGTPVKAFIIGDGPERKGLEERGRELGLRIASSHRTDPEADIVVTSWIRGIDVVWAGIVIAVMTSFNEGTPVSLIEAQAAERPVVSTRVGGVASIVDHEASGILLDERDPIELFSALQRLVEDGSMRREWGRKGWERVRERFSVERLCSDMEKLYRRELEEVPA
jgi:glycosyltransferase involved in cell wall biosynthesis